MNKTQKAHFALIIKYTGISFITGGLSHGFFSGERQIITSLVGIGFFIVGTLLEQKTKEKDYMRTILFGSILAVAIGALTGGLQHFPDSPTRSAWIVPLGFIVSVYSYFALEGHNILKKQHLVYTVTGFIASILLSFLCYWIVSLGYIGGAGGHGHGSGGHGDTGHSEQVIEDGNISIQSANGEQEVTTSELKTFEDGHIDDGSGNHGHD